jgi:hypothetical protein
LRFHAAYYLNAKAHFSLCHALVLLTEAQEAEERKEGEEQEAQKGEEQKAQEREEQQAQEQGPQQEPQ